MDCGQDLRAGGQKPGFCDNISLSPADLLKNSVSFVEARKLCTIVAQKLGCKAMKLKWLIPAINRYSDRINRNLTQDVCLTIAVVVQ